MSKERKNFYEGDFHGLAVKHFFKEILSKNKKKLLI